MKNLKLITILVSLGLVLSACSGKKSSSVSDSSSEEPSSSISSSEPEPEPEPEPAKNIDEYGLEYSDVNIFNPGSVKTNVEEVEVIGDPTAEFKMLAKDKQFDYENVVGQIGNSILQVKNEEGYIGFYSLLNNDWIVAPRLVPGTFSYSSWNISQIDRVLQISYEDQYFLYDALGNLLHVSEYAYNSSSMTLRNKLYYLSLVLNDGITYVFEYDAKGKAKEVPEVPDQIVINENVEEYDGPKLNEIFKEGSIELDGYGLKGYEMMRNGQGYITVFQNGSAVSSFYIDNNVNLIGIVDTSIYFQLYTQLNEEAEEYSFSVGNNKYFLETFKIDIKTGARTELDLKVLFTRISPLVDSNGNVNVYLAEYQLITKALTLGQRMRRLVDKQFIFHEYYGISEPTDLLQIAENRYYDAGNRVLYDENLKPITYLSNLNNLQRYDRQKVFVGQVDGKYGLIDFNGKVVAEFVYDSIYVNLGRNNKYIVTKDGIAYRLTAGSNNLENLGTGFTQIDTNLFRAKDSANGKYNYFTTSSNLFALDTDAAFDTYSYTVLGNKTAMFKYVEYEEDEELVQTAVKWHYFELSADVFAPQAIAAEVKGQEANDEIFAGDDFDTALPLAEGLNKVDNRVSYNRRYVSFVAPEDGYYGFFMLNTESRYNSMYCRDASEEDSVFGTTTSYVYDYDPFVYEEHLFTHFIQINAVKGYEYAFQLQNSKQLGYVLIDKIDGLTANTAIDGSIAGMGLPVAFTAPKYLPNVDSFYVKLRSINSVPYDFSLTGPKDSGIALDDVQLNEVSLFADSKKSAVLNSATSSTTYKVVANKAIAAEASVVLNVAETTDELFVKGQLFNNPNEIKNDELNVANEFVLTSTTNYAGFAKFAPVNGGNYRIQSTLSNTMNDLVILSFNADKEIVYSYANTYIYTNTQNVTVEDGGFLLVRYGFAGYAYASVTATFTITANGGQTCENPNALLATDVGSASLYVNGDAKGYRYYRFTAADAGKFAIDALEPEKLEMFYRTSDDAEGFTKFDGSFAYAKDDVVTVKLVASEDVDYFYAVNVDSSDATAVKMNVGDAAKKVTFENFGDRKQVKISNNKDQEVHLAISSDYNFDLFISKQGFVENNSGYEVNDADFVITLKAGESICLTLVATINEQEILIDAKPMDNPISIFAACPSDSKTSAAWVEDEEKGYVAPKVAYPNVAEMYIQANIHGRVKLTFNTGSRGYVKIFRQVADANGEYKYADRYQSNTVWENYVDYTVTLSNVAAGERIIIQFVAYSGDYTGMAAELTNIAYIHA